MGIIAKTLSSEEIPELRKALIGTEVSDNKGRKYLVSEDPIDDNGDFIYGLYGKEIDVCIAGFSDGSMVVAMKNGRAVLSKKYFLKVEQEIFPESSTTIQDRYTQDR